MRQLASTKQFNVHTLFAAASLVTFGVLLLWVFTRWFDPFDDKHFRPSDWNRSSNEVRAGMCDDLISNRLQPGMTESEVVSLLGKPEESLTGETDGGGNRLIGDETYSYYIGSWSGYGLDDAFLYVHFDSSGKVLTAEVNGY